MNRRQFLAASAALSIGAHLRAQDAATDLPSERKHGGSREKVLPRVSPFPLSQVRLLPGVFAQEAEKNARYLDSLSVDRLLYSFRAEAGLSNSAEPYGGWEAPNCELRGHFNGGHYLSACALVYATSSNEDLKRKGDRMVAALAQCQQKLNGGYLSAFPETFFDRLSREEKVWAPFYTLHKILAGLIDMYTLAGNERRCKWRKGSAAGLHNGARIAATRRCSVFCARNTAGQTKRSRTSTQSRARTTTSTARGVSSSRRFSILWPLIAMN